MYLATILTVSRKAVIATGGAERSVLPGLPGLKQHRDLQADLSTAGGPAHVSLASR